MGLIKVNEIHIKKSNGGGKIRICQESQHASHVLTFFVIMAHETIAGRRVGRRLLGRIMHHLMDLREFLEEGALNDLANELYVSIQNEYEGSLPLLNRAIHKSTRAVANTFDPQGKGRFFQGVSSLLILSSENEKRESICMYPWLVTNQSKILEFARAYAKESVFKGLIPLGMPQPHVGGQQK